MEPIISKATRKHSIQPLIGLEMTLVKDERSLSTFSSPIRKSYQVDKLSTLKWLDGKIVDFTLHLERCCMCSHVRGVNS